MSGFDPLSYAAAREAKPPAGALMPALQVDPSLLPPGWCQLDGSLVSRAVYPDAAKIVGDVRFFNAAPTEVSADLVMRAGVYSVGEMKFLATGSTFIAAGGSYTASGDTQNYRLWRSGDAGANWQAVDLPAMPMACRDFRVAALEWFGAGRILLVLTGVASNNNYGLLVTFSNDYGQTWSAPKQIVLVGTGSVALECVSADAEMITSGAGYYYIGLQNNQSSPASAALCALNPSNNTVQFFNIASDGSSAARCRVLGGRVVAAGTSEVYYAGFGSSAWWLGKVTFNGAAFSGNIGASLSGFNAASIVGTRQFLNKGGDGNYYWAYSGSILKMPPAWTGQTTTVIAGADNAGVRLLTNTLSDPATGQRYDINTGLSSVIGGMNAGKAKVGSMYGQTDRPWQEAVVFDKAPSFDRHFLFAPAVAGSLVARSTRCADNFAGGLGGTPDSAKFLTYPSTALNWFDPATGQLKSIDFVAGTPSKLRVRTFAPANDYATYLHLPYLPGLMGRMR